MQYKDRYEVVIKDLKTDKKYLLVQDKLHFPISPGKCRCNMVGCVFGKRPSKCTEERRHLCGSGTDRAVKSHFEEVTTNDL